LEGRILDALKNVLVLGRTALTNAFNATIGNTSILNFKPSFTSQEQYRKITPANFVQFANVIVPTREGFVGSYNAFADLLIEQLKYKDDLATNMQATDSLMGRLINNKDERISWRDDTAKIEQSVKLRQAMNDELKPFFAAPRDTAHARVGDLVSNVSDLKSVDAKAHQIESITKAIDLKKLRAGDMVFFNTMNRPYSHMGIYIGDGKFIHAPRTNSVIRVDTLASGYFADRLEGARTVFD
jgi:hypothetical protein